jgi:MIP family channel proteins
VIEVLPRRAEALIRAGELKPRMAEGKVSTVRESLLPLPAVATPRRSNLKRIFAAEFLGSFVMLLCGNGVCAQTLVSSAHGDCTVSAAGGFLSINWAWGLGVYFGIVVAGGVSGAHLNPAVTLSLAAHKRVPLGQVPVYVTAQLLGCFLAAAVVFAEYFAGLKNYTRICCAGQQWYEITDTCNLAGAFTTFPQSYESVWAGFFDQVLGTAILMLGIFAIGDEKNQKRPDWVQGFSVALLVVVIGMCFGFNTGYAINPARDAGPRLFTAIVGFGGAVYTGIVLTVYTGTVLTVYLLAFFCVYTHHFRSTWMVGCGYLRPNSRRLVGQYLV